MAGKQRVIVVMDDVAATDSLNSKDYKSHDRASTFELDGVRSLICENGFHDVSTLLWQGVTFFNIVATSRCTPSSNFAVTNHHFCTVQMEPLSSLSIQDMYCRVLHERILKHSGNGTGNGTGNGNGNGNGFIEHFLIDLIGPLVKATISTATLYKMTRKQLGIPPVQIDWMMLNLFAVKLKESAIVETIVDTFDINTNKTTNNVIIRKWFHHARAAFGDQCISPNAAKDLSDTLMSNLHAALGIRGLAVENKSRRISMVNSDISFNTEAISASVIFSKATQEKEKKAAMQLDPLDINSESLRKHTNVDFGQIFVGTQAKEHIELFQCMLSVLKTSSKPHVCCCSHDIMTCCGLLQLAMRRAFGDFSSSSLFDSGFKEEDQITLVRIGPIARSHGEKLVRSLFMKVLDLAASVLNQKNARIGLIVENADTLPVSMAALLTAITTGRYAGGYFTPNEKKNLIQKSLTGGDLGIDLCWVETFRRITSRITVGIIVRDISIVRDTSRMKCKVHSGCTVLALLKLSNVSRCHVALSLIQRYKGVQLEQPIMHTLAAMFARLESVIDDFKLERSDCTFLQSINDFLESLTRYSARGTEKIKKFETALRFQAVAKERSALLNAEGIALNWRLVLVNRKITNLANEVNKCQQVYGTESRKLFNADKDASAVKSSCSKLTQEIDKNLMKSNNGLAQARGTMRGVNHSDILRFLKEEELPRVVFRLGVAASQMLGDEIIENDEEELRDFLADPMLLARIVRYDPLRGPSKTSLLAARQTQSQPYSKDQVSKFGPAALALREWVHATASKIAVLSDIHPLYLQLDNAKLALTARNEALNAAFTSKQQCAERLRGWQKAYDDTIKDRQRLLNKLAIRKEKMETSMECARAVSSQVETWRQKLDELRVAQKTMLCDVWIGAGCLRYAAALVPGLRNKFMLKLKKIVTEEFFLPLSPLASFGCPSPGDRAEIDATMLSRDQHVGVYMLDKIAFPHIAVLVDPDSIARTFLSTTMKDEFDRTFDGDLKFSLALQHAQLNRTTLLIEHMGEENVSDAVWNLIHNTDKLLECQRIYPGFQIILSCDTLPKWIKYRGMSHFVVLDFSRPAGVAGDEVFNNVVDRLSRGNAKQKMQSLLINIAQDLSDYKDSIDKLLDLVGGNFEELIVNKQTTRRINEASLSVKLLQQRTDTASEKLKKAKDSQNGKRK